MLRKLPRVIWQDKVGDEVVRVVQQTAFDRGLPRFRFEVKITTKADAMGEPSDYWVNTQLTQDIAGRIATASLQAICKEMDKS